MTASRRDLLLVVAALLLGLTYLMMRSTVPDATEHQRILNALQVLDLSNASLQRDVLRARAGLLRNYDPLVKANDSLQGAAASLEAIGHAAETDSDRAVLAQHVSRLAAAIADQEVQVEIFKSDTALMQNSISAFNQQLLDLDAELPGLSAMRDQVGTVASVMLRFTRDPQGDIARELNLAINRLSLTATEANVPQIQALLAHGRLITATLPGVDAMVGQLQAGLVDKHVQAIQRVYLDQYGRAAARARFLRIALYGAAMGLAIYVGYLILQLRAKALVLQRQLALENLIASISTEFISLPLDRLDHGIEAALARLAEQANADRARVLILSGRTEDPIARHYVVPRAGGPDQLQSSGDLLDLAMDWDPEFGRQAGLTYVPDVKALPPGPRKARLTALGLQSWLSIPLTNAQGCLGYLMFEGISANVTDRGDIALLRTAGGMFVNALERQRAENERAAFSARLSQTQRLESLGTLAGGVAHEFNNILGAILGYGEMALAAVAAGSPAHNYIARVVLAGGRAKRVVDQILMFSRRSERQELPFRTEAAVSEALLLLRASLPAGIELRAHLNSGDAAIVGDATELQQVVMNLCTNAAHAMEGHGIIEVDLDRIDMMGAQALSHGQIKAGRYVRLRVKDTGHGMDGATLQRIAEPFFTTKGPGHGTGLGLSMVHGIVTAHGGGLDVRSAPGRGSCFSVYLAQADKPAVQDATILELPIPRGRGETVLLVEADARQRLLAEEMLAALGFEPVGVDCAQAALHAVQTDPDRFDAVLAEQILPDMPGSALARALRQRSPALAVLLATEHQSSVPDAEREAAGIRDVLQKPLRLRPLAMSLMRIGLGAFRRAPLAEDQPANVASVGQPAKSGLGDPDVPPDEDDDAAAKRRQSGRYDEEKADSGRG
ncbi:two-component system VirA-like sensor kinase [Indioceanicola profundi]|uniref:two-component system VirA-like sensor kinase n=1 Tax=Indioceanicola profundi TaxID=2220096 RepID=UPI000E6ACC7D|nr:two-component system VirA-like sensor kinase [Indioceanicola profundi]